MRQSLSWWDNDVIESFSSSLKKTDHKAYLQNP